MAPSERAKRVLRAVEEGSLEAHATLGAWHLQGKEGLEKDNVKAVAFLREAGDLGHAGAQSCLGTCYAGGWGVDMNAARAVAWWRKAADQGAAAAQYLLGEAYGLGQLDGVKKNLPLGKTYLELSAEQGDEDAVTLLKELRKCVSCGELDVHHMICSRCRKVRFCGKECQLEHWNHPTDPHKLHCVQRRESAGAGVSSGRVKPPAHLDQIAAAAAVRATGNDLFREQKYPEVGGSIKWSTVVNQ
jgi:ribosomal protein L32